MKLKLTCYVRRTEQLRHSPVGNTGHFIVWLVPHNVVNKLKIWFGSTITGNSFTSSHLKKKLVSQQYIYSEVYTLSLSLFNFYEIQRSFIKLWAHFVPPNKKLTISNNSEKVFISLWTNIAYWISLLEYIVRTRVQQGGLWMLKPCIQVGTGLCIQTGQSVCVLCLRMSLS